MAQCSHRANTQNRTLVARKEILVKILQLGHGQRPLRIGRVLPCGHQEVALDVVGKLSPRHLWDSVGKNGVTQQQPL